jgi:hypothetical protein
MPYKTHTFRVRFAKPNEALRFVDLDSHTPLGIERFARNLNTEFDSTWTATVFWIDPRNLIAREVVDFDPSWRRTLVGERDAHTLFD